MIPIIVACEPRECYVLRADASEGRAIFFIEGSGRKLSHPPQFSIMPKDHNYRVESATGYYPSQLNGNVSLLVGVDGGHYSPISSSSRPANTLASCKVPVAPTFLPLTEAV